MKEKDIANFRKMKEKIDEIEKNISELKDLGKGMPVVEKNARCMLSFTHNLKFGISDVAELNE